MLKENLEKNGYRVISFDTAQEAVQWLDAQIDAATVGFGGSMTVKQTGIYDLLKTHNRAFWHADVPQGETAFDVRMHARETDVYIASANAVAETGEIVNIDGMGNRVAEITFGHKEVYLLIGKNKIAPDLESAVFRARNVAAPKNAQRLGRNTPCAVKGDKCYNCDSPERICRALSVLWRAPTGAKYTVLLIGEELGF